MDKEVNDLDAESDDDPRVHRGRDEFDRKLPSPEQSPFYIDYIIDAARVYNGPTRVLPGKSVSEDCSKCRGMNWMSYIESSRPRTGFPSTPRNRKISANGHPIPLKLLIMCTLHQLGGSTTYIMSDLANIPSSVIRAFLEPFYRALEEQGFVKWKTFPTSASFMYPTTTNVFTLKQFRDTLRQLRSRTILSKDFTSMAEVMRCTDLKL